MRGAASWMRRQQFEPAPVYRPLSRRRNRAGLLWRPLLRQRDWPFPSQDTYLGEANTPPSLHRYLYAYANPLRYVDLTGYSAETVTPEEYNSSALESEATFSGEMTTTQRGGYVATTGRGDSAAGMVEWINGEHPSQAEETQEPMTGAWGGDTARRVQRYAKEVKKNYDQDCRTTRAS